MKHVSWNGLAQIHITPVQQSKGALWNTT